MKSSTIFKYRHSQAVRLPSELRFPDGVKQVDVRAKGNERVISPTGQMWDSFFHNGPIVSNDFMAERCQSDSEPQVLK